MPEPELLGFVSCVLFLNEGDCALARPQSGFALTLSLRRPHDRRLGYPRNGLGACQWAACQHTARLRMFDVPHEGERTDGRKGRDGWTGDGKKEVRTGECNTREGERGSLFPRSLCMTCSRRSSVELSEELIRAAAGRRRLAPQGTTR